MAEHSAEDEGSQEPIGDPGSGESSQEPVAEPGAGAGTQGQQADSELEVALPSSPQAPSIARQAMREFATCEPRTALNFDALLLLVSEVVTNAVTHPQVADVAEVELSMVVAAELIRVVISDRGMGFERPDDAIEADRVGGYGLMLLDALASRWGTLSAPARFSVWFEIDHAS